MFQDNRDLEAMYKAATIGDKITIWCEACKEEQSGETSVPRIGHKRKSADSDGDDALPAKRAEKIEELASQLHKKHGEVYTMPHLRIWARMILNKQHKVWTYHHHFLY